MNTISYMKICIKIVICCNYVKVRLFKSALNTPNQNTSYLKIQICITKIRQAKSKICSYLVEGERIFLVIDLLKALTDNFYPVSS